MPNDRIGFVPRLRRWIAAALGVYWLALFISTHIPIPRGVVPPEVSDKSLHLVAYFGLAFLLCLWRSARAEFTGRALGACLLFIAAYAVLEELLQIPVNRHADVRDFAADMLGAVAGVLVFIGVRRWFSGLWNV